MSDIASKFRALADNTAIRIMDAANRPSGRLLVAETLLILIRGVAEHEREECAEIATMNGNVIIAGAIKARSNLPEWREGRK